MTKPVELIVARDQNGGIGREGNLIWSLPTDMAFFKQKTLATEHSDRQNMVLMGRRTWDSIPERFRPLAGRVNGVLSRNPGSHFEGAERFSSLEAALSWGNAHPEVESIFIIGGGVLYAEALTRPETRGAWVTEVEGTFDCDTFFPPLDVSWVQKSVGERIVENGLGFQIARFERQD